MDYNLLQQLRNWARFKVRENDSGTGYPTSSPSCREYRPLPGNTWEPPPVRPCQLAAERMDGIIMALPAELINVIRIAYLGIGLIQDRLVKEGIARYKYHRRINQAHQMIKLSLDTATKS